MDFDIDNSEGVVNNSDGPRMEESGLTMDVKVLINFNFNQK